MHRRIAIGILAAAAVLGGWWLLSPLVLDRFVNEAAPGQELTDAERDLLQRIESLTPEQLQRMPEKQRDDTMRAFTTLQEKLPAVRMNEAPPKEQAAVLAQGSFIDGDTLHRGSGEASVLRLADGALVLRLSDFMVTNGPALHVYLTADEDGGTERGFVDLGPLKGNRGNQNYDIPEEVEISQYKGVAIWCVPFGVLFSSARL